MGYLLWFNGVQMSLNGYWDMNKSLENTEKLRAPAFLR